MKLIGLLKLEEFKQKHADSRGPLNSWEDEIQRATWDGPHDIKKRYPSASFLADNIIIFNIKGNKYRLAIKIKYQNGIALIEWIGTHSQYNNKKFT